MRVTFHEWLAFQHRSVCCFTVRHGFCHSPPVSNSNSHCTVFCYPSRFVDWKKRKKWVKSLRVKAFKRTQEREQMRKEVKRGFAMWRRCPLVKERYDMDRIAACFLHQQLSLLWTRIVLWSKNSIFLLSTWLKVSSSIAVIRAVQSLHCELGYYHPSSLFGFSPA